MACLADGLMRLIVDSMGAVGLRRSMFVVLHHFERGGWLPRSGLFELGTSLNDSQDCGETTKSAMYRTTFNALVDVVSVFICLRSFIP